MAQTFLYGKHTQGLEPTLLHPNEMPDGALVNGTIALRRGLPRMAIHIIFSKRELYRRHGQDINFLGVVIGRGWQDSQDAQRAPGLDDGPYGSSARGAGRHHECRCGGHKAIIPSIS